MRSTTAFARAMKLAPFQDPIVLKVMPRITALQGNKNLVVVLDEKRDLTPAAPCKLEGTVITCPSKNLSAARIQKIVHSAVSLAAQDKAKSVTFNLNNFPPSVPSSSAKDEVTASDLLNKRVSLGRGAIASTVAAQAVASMYQYNRYKTKDSTKEKRSWTFA